MRRQGSGRSINISSVLGFLPMPYGAQTNAIAADTPMAEYGKVRAHVDAVTKELFTKADDPSVVAEAVLQAATAERPKPRYTAGKRAKVLSLLRAFAPASAVDAGIRKNLRLHLLPTE
jgi:NAD(P)-dependent dehydrogenase (short-subunit alcohol dehydrogenase family)